MISLAQDDPLLRKLGQIEFELENDILALKKIMFMETINALSDAMELKLKCTAVIPPASNILWEIYANNHIQNMYLEYTTKSILIKFRQSVILSIHI